MSQFRMECFEQRLDNSNYESVIWEDILPIEKKVDDLEYLVVQLIEAISNAESIEQLQSTAKQLLNETGKL